MLKNIPKALTPELLKVLAEMGHGDRICIGDGNFPGSSIASRSQSIYLFLNNVGTTELLDAILTVFPLDEYVEHPVLLMEKAECDKNIETPIWKEFETTIAKHDERGAAAMGFCDRQEYYRQAGMCYCVVVTGESAIYANVILQKGIVKG